jgi:hypothetical protein
MLRPRNSRTGGGVNLVDAAIWDNQIVRWVCIGDEAVDVGHD